MLVIGEQAEENEEGDGNHGEDEDSVVENDEDRELRKRTWQETRSQILYFVNSEKAIENTSPNSITFPLLTVQCDMLKDQLIKKARQMSTKLLEGFTEEMKKFMEEVNDDFAGKLSRLQVRTITQ